MRKLIAATMLAGVMMVSADAALADGMRGSLKDAPVVTAPTWSGFYIGAGIGYGHLISKNNYSGEDETLSSNIDSASGGLGTITIGFDRLVRERYVVGLFAEYDWSNIEMNYREDDYSGGFTLNNTFSIGGRAGFLMTPTSLLYMTAGYSWTDGDVKNDYFDIGGVGVSSLDLQGAFVGLGMETQLGRNWSLKGEVRYTMYDSINTSVTEDWTDKLDANLLTGRIAVVYKFNRDEPHVAPIK